MSGRNEEPLRNPVRDKLGHGAQVSPPSADRDVAHSHRKTENWIHAHPAPKWQKTCD